ncbi:MAG TPA: ABC transporter permease subunit [Clostridia bacterium]|nr:ABC transporter permease subunit [Clostridia bacterium]
MYNQLKSEFYRITKFKSSYIAPILITVLIVLSFIMAWFVVRDYGVLSPGSEYMGRSLVYSSSSNGSLPFFIAILSSIFIAGSFSNGSIKMSLSRGANRIQLYSAKLITVSAMAVGLCIFSFIVSGLLSIALGFGNSLAEFEIMAALGEQVLIALAYTSLFTFLATLIRSTGGAVGASIGIYLFSTLLTTILTAIGMSTQKMWLIDLTQCFLTTQLTTATSIPPIENWQLLCVLLVPLAYIVITTGLGMLSFRKRDIK